MQINSRQESWSRQWASPPPRRRPCSAPAATDPAASGAEAHGIGPSLEPLSCPTSWALHAADQVLPPRGQAQWSLLPGTGPCQGCSWHPILVSCPHEKCLPWKIFTPKKYSLLKNIHSWKILTPEKYSAPIMHKILSLSLSSQEDSQYNILNPWTPCFW